MDPEETILLPFLFFSFLCLFFVGKEFTFLGAILNEFCKKKCSIASETRVCSTTGYAMGYYSPGVIIGDQSVMRFITFQGNHPHSIASASQSILGTSAIDHTNHQIYYHIEYTSPMSTRACWDIADMSPMCLRHF